MTCIGLVAGCSTATTSPVTEGAVAASSREVASEPRTLSYGCDADLLTSLTVRRKLAQMLNVGVTGTADALSIVEREQIGGIFIGSWTDEAMLANHEVGDVKAASQLPLMVTIDEEGGRVSRVAKLLGEDPAPRVVAATMTVEQTYQMALERGRGLAELGITANYAPVVDVSAQPANSVIGDRSFSDDPQVVLAYAGAYARGLRDAGILPVIKHFPGHGSASGDSHTGAVTTPPLAQLLTSDLVPFQGLADTGVGVMLGHLEVPGLTAPNVPASVSPDAVALLRTGVGYGAPAFTGPIFTDDLSGMRAITDRFGIADAVAAALRAGVDIALWLTTAEVPRVLDHLEKLVENGELSLTRIDEAVVTIARAKGVAPC